MNREVSLSQWRSSVPGRNPGSIHNRPFQPRPKTGAVYFIARLGAPPRGVQTKPSRQRLVDARPISDTRWPHRCAPEASGAAFAEFPQPLNKWEPARSTSIFPAEAFATPSIPRKLLTIPRPIAGLRGDPDMLVQTAWCRQPDVDPEGAASGAKPKNP